MLFLSLSSILAFCSLSLTFETKIPPPYDFVEQVLGVGFNETGISPGETLPLNCEFVQSFPFFFVLAVFEKSWVWRFQARPTVMTGGPKPGKSLHISKYNVLITEYFSSHNRTSSICAYTHLSRHLSRHHGNPILYYSPLIPPKKWKKAPYSPPSPLRLTPIPQSPTSCTGSNPISSPSPHW